MSEFDLAGRTLGGYQVDGLLGRGGFGWVHLARQLSLDRTVALKVLDPVVARDPDAARRFEREGRSAALLDHPAIIDVFDAGSANGLHFIAMRLIDGIALDELLRRRRLTPPEVAVLLARIAAALDHAHVRGVVHRDVKPANILLQQGDPAQAWLGDFGIALSIRLAGALSTTTMGTAHYMAPEQRDPARVGPASDQYSLACVAYQALTGRRPFGADSDDVMAVLLAHHTESAPPTGSAAVDAVFATALAKSPADRYPTVGEFAAALTEAIHRAPTPRPRSRRLLLTGGAAALTVAAAAAFALSGNGERPAAQTGWTTVQGPGDATFQVPPDWRRENGGAVVTFTRSEVPLLTVGGDPSGTDPAQDLRNLYGCTGPVDTAAVAGLPAAACDAGDRHATVVSARHTTVRFSFTTEVSANERDQVLATLTIE